MKKLFIALVVVAIFVAFYEQGKEHPNMYVMIAAIVVFMFGMMRLSAKTPSKNQDKDNEDV